MSNEMQRSPSAHIQGQEWNQTVVGFCSQCLRAVRMFLVPRQSRLLGSVLERWPAGADGQPSSLGRSPYVLPSRILAGQPACFGPQNVPCALRPALGWDLSSVNSSQDRIGLLAAFPLVARPSCPTSGTPPCALLSSLRDMVPAKFQKDRAGDQDLKGRFFKITSSICLATEPRGVWRAGTG